MGASDLVKFGGYEPNLNGEGGPEERGPRLEYGRLFGPGKSGRPHIFSVASQRSRKCGASFAFTGWGGPPTFSLPRALSGGPPHSGHCRRGEARGGGSPPRHRNTEPGLPGAIRCPATRRETEWISPDEGAGAASRGSSNLLLLRSTARTTARWKQGAVALHSPSDLEPRMSSISFRLRGGCPL